MESGVNYNSRQSNASELSRAEEPQARVEEPAADIEMQDQSQNAVGRAAENSQNQLVVAQNPVALDVNQIEVQPERAEEEQKEAVEFHPEPIASVRSVHHEVSEAESIMLTEDSGIEASPDQLNRQHMTMPVSNFQPFQLSVRRAGEERQDQEQINRV